MPIPNDRMNEREKKSHRSRPLLPCYPRTLETWELGGAEPTAEAALLTRVVAQFPDMVQRHYAI
ncbi:MAG: addiction module antitoxin [Rhodoferax sp.]